MQPTLLTQPHTAPHDYNAPRLPLGPMPQAPRGTGKPSIDSLLRDLPSQQAAVDVEPEFNVEPGPGIFMGLRIALMFNAGLGIAALLAYEAWTMLAH